MIYSEDPPSRSDLAWEERQQDPADSIPNLTPPPVTSADFAPRLTCEQRRAIEYGIDPHIEE